MTAEIGHHLAGNYIVDGGRDDASTESEEAVHLLFWEFSIEIGLPQKLSRGLIFTDSLISSLLVVYSW